MNETWGLNEAVNTNGLENYTKKHQKTFVSSAGMAGTSVSQRSTSHEDFLINRRFSPTKDATEKEHPKMAPASLSKILRT